MIYVYDCCGELPQTVKDMETCPECGRTDTYNFAKSTLERGDRSHSRVHCIPGERNYYDEQMGKWVGNNKKEVMEAGGFKYAANGSAYDG